MNQLFRLASSYRASVSNSSNLRFPFNPSALHQRLAFNTSRRSALAHIVHRMPPAGDLSPAMEGTREEKYKNFDLVKRFKLPFADIRVSKWRSRVTGLTVAHLDYDGKQTYE